MKIFKKLSLSVLAITIGFSFIPFASAATGLGVITAPKANTTFYRGETIKYKAQVTNNDPYNPGYPFMLITKENSAEEAYKQFTLMVPGETSVLTGSFPTAKIKSGTYYIVAYMNYYNPYATNQKGDYIQNKIFIKDLKAPTKLKAIGKKKKVKLTYKKANGASKYYIYKSTKKSSKYKLVTTTNKTTYTIKKLKKHKKYYFKVKTLRNVNGKVTSSYSKVVSAKTK